MSNLAIAFPHLSDADRKKIAKKFYHNFIDSFIEVIKLVSADDDFLQKRFTVDVKELNNLYGTGKSCQIHLGHTFNWEWGQLVLARLTKFKIMVVYMPITSVMLEKLFYKLRTRSGNVFLPANNMRESIAPYLHTQYALGLVADQNPGNMTTPYWLNFFGKPTAFVSNPEKCARAGGMPVVFAYIEKTRRGHYRATTKLATPDSSLLPEGKLTLDYVRFLEEVIRRNPDMWLWSHRRWKHTWKAEYAPLWIDCCEMPVEKRTEGLVGNFG